MADAREYKIIISTEDSDLDVSIKKAQELGKVAEADAKKYDALGDAIKAGVTDELKAAGLTAKTFSDALTKGATATSNGFKSLRTQLQEAKNDMVRFGQGTKEFDEARNRAANLKAEIADMNDTLAALDPDAKAKAFNQFGQAAFGAFQVATGALQAFGIESERVNKLAQQFQGFINITQGLSQLGQLGDSLKNIGAVLGITSTAQKAATAATVAGTVALEGEALAATEAAVATKGFNASLLLPGIGAALLLLGLVAAALASIAQQAEAAGIEAAKLGDLQKSASDSLRDLTDAQREYDRLTGKITETQAAVASLNEEFLKTTAPLQKALADQDKAINQTKSNIDSYKARIASLEQGPQRDATPAIIAQQNQLLKVQEDLLKAQEANKTEQVRKLTALEKKLTLEIAGENKKQADDAKKSAEDATKSAQAEAEKRVAIERQLLVERQKLALIGINDPAANLAKQIANQKELYRFDLANLAITNQNKELLTAQHLARIEELNQQSRDRIFSEVLKDQERDAAEIDKKNKERVKTEDALFIESQRRRSILSGGDIQTELDLLKERYEREKQNAERTGKDTTAIKAKYDNDKLELERKLGKALTEEQQARVQEALTVANSLVSAYTSYINAVKEISQISTDERIEDINTSSDAELERQQTLLKDKAINQTEYDKRVREIEAARVKETKKLEKEQAQRDKQLTIFTSTIQSSLAIITTLAQPNISFAVKVAQALAIAAATAAQIAAINAAPLPKFARGSERITGRGTETSDQVPALLSVGERVVTARENREYWNTLTSIHNRTVSSRELNAFVQLPSLQRQAILLQAGTQFSKATNISTAQLMNNYVNRSINSNSSTSIDLAPLRRDIRNNKEVNLSNAKQIADQIASRIVESYNIRRKW